jgi:hypothetical protein
MSIELFWGKYSLDAITGTVQGPADLEKIYFFRNEYLHSVFSGKMIDLIKADRSELN